MSEREKLKVAIIIGSETDLIGSEINESQLLEGLEALAAASDKVLVIGVYAYSQHRNTEPLQDLIKRLIKEGVEVIITGAGWANHLSGCTDALIRYTIRDAHVIVLGVAFEDKSEGSGKRHTEAAILSMTEVPGTKLIYQDEEGVFVGPAGFLRACQCAIKAVFPIVELPKLKPEKKWTLEEAIKVAKDALALRAKAA
ncbi:MAG: AIR carboxylase family protein [Planctomycetes bacterium]|jgi:phosphoribosylcarboxyaminoimidazole (NCAIR) mutase|nr:AIR carboxylase family protein [Planctomycetota bacterium]